MIITFGEQDQAWEIKVKYLVIDAPISYNMIIVHPYFNQLDAILSTLYWCMKYALHGIHVGFVQGDQEIDKKCHVGSLKLKRILTPTDEELPLTLLSLL